MKPRARTVRRSRLVPETIDGHTELVLDHYDIEVPVPPRDWDQALRTAVTAGACLLVTISVIWSTASIGDLLNRVVIAPAAYGAALAFDAAWIMCMAVEWLFRYDPARAQLPLRAGHAALLIARGAVGAHGYIAGAAVIGVVGALVSGLAKGGWVVAMTVHARPLNDRTQQWVEKRRAALDGQMAMIPIRRDLMRGQALIEAERRALELETDDPANPGPDPATDTNPDPGPDHPEHRSGDPDAQVLPLASGPMTLRDAVRTAMDCGIREPDAVLRYVRKVADPDAKPETVARYVRTFRSAG